MKEAPRMKRTKLFGTLASATWILGFAGLILWKHASLGNLSLNEWGDLFSGFAAPAALIWLIFGYIQQGEELRLNTHALEAQQEEFRLNTEALKGQQEELHRQVAATISLAESTARLAKATEDQLKEFQRNTDALHGQQEELKKQAQATGTLAESTAKMARAAETLLALQQAGMAGKVLKALLNPTT